MEIWNANRSNSFFSNFKEFFGRKGSELSLEIDRDERYFDIYEKCVARIF